MDNEVFAINVASRVGYGIMIIAIPYYVTSNLGLVGVVLATYPIAEALASIPVGLIVNRFRVSSLVSIGLLIMATSSLLFAINSNWVILAALHGLMGVAAAMIIVPLLTAVTRRRVRLGLGYGGFFSTYFAGYIIGIGIGGLMQGIIEHGFEAARLSIVTAATIFLAALPLALTLKGHRGPGIMAKSLRLRSVELIPLPLWLGLMILLGVAFTLPGGLTRHLNIGGGFVALIYVSAALVLALGILMFGSLVDRVGAIKVMAIGLVGLSVVIGVAYLVVSGLLSIYYAIAPLAPSMFLTSALVPSIYAYVGHRAEEGSEGLIMGIYNIPTAAGIAIGNLIGGFSLSRLGLDLTIILAALTLVIAVALTAVMWMALRGRGISLNRQST